jgi:hypothetical protein
MALQQWQQDQLSAYLSRSGVDNPVGVCKVLETVQLYSLEQLRAVTDNMLVDAGKELRTREHPAPRIIMFKRAAMQKDDIVRAIRSVRCFSTEIYTRGCHSVSRV